ncbi:uncharacterized protein DUF5103 [Lutibacter sp. Hel_I_33_5]|uniref:type IX secretion system plug protein n=1 Tax=Lutibacter sp. Hel_I_33_5 TaxID=1566289 RepID=UPI0011A64131|nr:DUF5103 domain-containing protein [Lutibacter sp. Hel_I_33_5]TVZ56787.1 uncharacterized protein DUF5103 [Lutibacter sp. Hel_I_33_5]
MKKLFSVCFLVVSVLVQSQNIKTIQLRPLQENNFSSIVPLGTTLELSFDDLEADSKNYQYKIEHMTYDWKPSSLLSNQYLNGFQQNEILNVNNSFNTLQNYTHYSVRIPNQNTIITKSGNYLLSVLDEYDDIVFTRRFTLYENKATVGVVVNRSRNAKTLNQQQTVSFRINYPELQINNPQQEIKVAVLQNEIWQTVKTDIQPQFFKQNQLIYNYTDKLNFWGGNEYLFFDTKVVRNPSLNIRFVEKGDIFNNYLYPFENKEVKKYTYNPDINGQFIVRTIEASNNETEADYANMHFSLEVLEPFNNKEVYVYGAFNNFKLIEENRMVYDEKNYTYNTNFSLKQGFYNYTFVTKNEDGNIENSDIRGDFSSTENQYTVLVYYRAFGGLFDRVIGVGNNFFEGER